MCTLKHPNHECDRETKEFHLLHRAPHQTTPSATLRGKGGGGKAEQNQDGLGTVRPQG